VKIIVLRAGDAAAPVAAERGEFDLWIREAVGDAFPGAWETIDVRGDGAPPAPDAADGFVITGSAHSVTERAPWMLRVEAWIRDLEVAGAPLLGICFGHQLITQALGGEVARNPRGREIGTVTLDRLGDDPLLDALPPAFGVQTTHVDAAVRLPPRARLLGRTERDPNAIFAVGASMRAVQFHPEIDADAMRRYVDARAAAVREDGLDPDAIRRAVRETEENGRILKNFVTRFVLPYVAARAKTSAADAREPRAAPGAESGAARS